jgi:hypothetical protein
MKMQKTSKHRRGAALSFVAAVMLAVALLMPTLAIAASCSGGAMLTVRDSQSGFAGKTGTVWTIKPDCSYEVARFHGGETSAPHRHGQLTPQQQTELSGLLASASLDSLPAQIGEPAPVNAHQLSIDYQGRTIVLSLGMGNETPDRESGPAQRVINLGNAVKALIGGE